MQGRAIKVTRLSGALLLTALLMQGCGFSHSVQVDKSSAFEVHAPDGQIVDIPPEHQLHKALTDWINEHRNGWDQYIVTLPGNGNFISGDSFQLYVTETAVFFLQKDATALFRRLEDDDRQLFDELVQFAINN